MCEHPSTHTHAHTHTHTHTRTYTLTHTDPQSGIQTDRGGGRDQRQASIREEGSDGWQGTGHKHEVEQEEDDRWQMEGEGVQGGGIEASHHSACTGVQGEERDRVSRARGWGGSQVEGTDVDGGGGGGKTRMFECPDCEFRGQCTGVQILKHRREHAIKT